MFLVYYASEIGPFGPIPHWDGYRRFPYKVVLNTSGVVVSKHIAPKPRLGTISNTDLNHRVFSTYGFILKLDIWS